MNFDPVNQLVVLATSETAETCEPTSGSSLLRERQPNLTLNTDEVQEEATMASFDYDEVPVDTAQALATTLARLARRNEALEEFAALVAHELKSPLLAALATGDQSGGVRQAIDLVDALLELSRDAPGSGIASPAACLDAALRDLLPNHISVTAQLPARLPLPPAALTLLFRNLLRNAVAAGAISVRVSASRRSTAWSLQVQDDGVGLNSEGRYQTGHGLGLRLCQSIARRYGGSLAVQPSPTGGTQAVLEFGSAA